MKFTLSWLKDHLETQANLEDITDRLTSTGFELETLDDKSSLAAFQIARIVSACKHPAADRLQVLKVDVGGKEPFSVVCGAENARAGLMGVFAPPGTYVPGLDVQLAVANIRGVQSFGMMCSAKELMLSDEHLGIIELPSNALPGESFSAFSGLNDPVVQISLTPDRPDAASVHGIARDLGASGIGRLRPLCTKQVPGLYPCSIKVDMSFDRRLEKNPCHGLAVRMIQGIKNASSPPWLQRRLLDIGLSPVNVCVDITNYVMFDYGYPLHVFDAAKLTGNLTVRHAFSGETLLALNGRQYNLTPQACILADRKGPVSLAGIIGGKESGCLEETTDILIESALWEPLSVARTGRMLNLSTDARYRFERGVDPELMIPALEKATAMIIDLCGGEASEIEVSSFRQSTPRHIFFPLSEIRRLAGIDVARDSIIHILLRLGFSVQEAEGGALDVIPPSWRQDIEGKADLVAEVVRIYGINKIAAEPLEKFSSAALPRSSLIAPLAPTAKRALALRGMVEAITWSFISKKHAGHFGELHACLELMNPVSPEMSYLRPSLLPGLILAGARNADRGFRDIALFEVSCVYQKDAPGMQRLFASGVRQAGACPEGHGRNWSRKTRNVNMFDVKEDVLSLLDACRIPLENLHIENNGSSCWHPGRSAVFMLGSRILAVFGEIHPNLAQITERNEVLAGFEVFLDVVTECSQKIGKTRENHCFPCFQPVRRDFAFIIEREVTADEVVNAALSADRNYITRVSVFDVFEDPSLGLNKKSIAIEVTIQPSEKIFRDEDLHAISYRIIQAVSQSTKAVLRS